MSLEIIEAQPAHCAIILSLIKELAVFEKLENDVVATEESLRYHLFEKKSAHCVIAFKENEVVGFALYFYNFSTFLSKQGLYLEDLFVKVAYRGKGYGKQLLLHLVETALKNNCGRMEWSVLNWNKEAICFYEQLGAKPMKEWTVYMLDEKDMKNLV